MIRIGITEAGDPSLKYGWEDRLDEVNGAILITKNLTDKLMERILSHQDTPMILHISCTGYGHTAIEPNLPYVDQTIHQVKQLIQKGFDPARLVLRIDPILPTITGIEIFEHVLSEFQREVPEIQRVRISVLDYYPHVQKRFEQAGLKMEFPSSDFFTRLNQKISMLKLRYPNLSFESCAEPRLKETNQIGCISNMDLERMGLPLQDERFRKNQRKDCGCLAGKTELLSYYPWQTGYNHCYGCLYCYWKTKKDKAG